MSAEHRKPFVAFVALALAVVGLIGVQRADAQHGQVVAAAIGAQVEVRGHLPVPADPSPAATSHILALGPAFAALAAGAGLSGNLLPSGTPVATLALEGRVAQTRVLVGPDVRRSPRGVAVLKQKSASTGVAVQAGSPGGRQRATASGGSGPRVSTRWPTPPPASQASPRARQAAAGAAPGARRDAARHRSPREARTVRGR